LIRWSVIVLALALAAPTVARDRMDADGTWRPHQLDRCQRPAAPFPEVRSALDEAGELFALENGGDAVSVLEHALRSHPRSPWLRFMLAQIYILAGQGEPHCQPFSGPVAPTGDWPRDRRRYLERADHLLGDLVGTWPDDGIVWFLRADAARGLNDPESASEYDLRGRECCTRRQTIEFVADMRDLNRKTAELLTPIVPEYPAECLQKRITGQVVLDVLIDPQGRVADTRAVNRADRRLVAAASEAAADAGYQAARVGYYPIWSWIEVSIHFTLDN
jgi:TonB family protein